MTEEHILVVCTANVCRSPLAELALRRGLGADSAIAVSSAGVRANPGDAICTLVGSLHDDEDWRDLTAEHRAREVTAELIEQSDIVLAASRDIRGELVRLAPRSRDWMFTLKEAAHLGAGFSYSDDDRVSAYVAYLDRSRSRTAPLAPPSRPAGRLRRLLMRGDIGDLASITDGHGTRRHRETLVEVEAAVAAILGQLGGGQPAAE